MSDTVYTGTAYDNQIRYFAASTTGLVQQANEYHHPSPTACAALGRMLTAGAMMGYMLKNDDDKLTLQIISQGPIGGITVTVDSKGNVKGYVNNPEADAPPKAKGKLNVGAIVAPGLLQVIRDTGLKEPYVGECALVSGEIAEDLTYYFATSDQIPTSVALGVLVGPDHSVQQAGGFIFQVMPYAEDSTITALENGINAFSKETSVTACMSEGMSPSDIIEKVVGKGNYIINEKNPTRFYCGCSKEHVAGALATLNKSEIQKMIDDGEPVEVRCHFCNSTYTYTPEDLKKLL